jgi:hypothetical protein
VLGGQGQKECAAEPPYIHGLTEPTDIEVLSMDEVDKLIDKVYRFRDRWEKRYLGDEATMKPYADLLNQISPGLSRKIYEQTLGSTVNFDNAE